FAGFQSRIQRCRPNWQPAASFAGVWNGWDSISNKFGRWAVTVGGGMPTNRKYIKRPNRAQISPDQEMSLWLGGPAFESPEARKAAWFKHRDRLIGILPSSSGRRPQAWWQYEATIPYPGYDHERSTLYAAGALGDAEKADLEIEWRREFNRAQ